MLAYTWPGNVRELQNVVRHIVVLNDAETVELDMLPPALLQGGEGNTRPLSSLRSTLMPAAPVPPATPAAVARSPEIEPLDTVVRRTIEQAIALSDGNIPKAAAALQVSPSTLYRRIQAWQAEETTTPPPV